MSQSIEELTIKLHNAQNKEDEKEEIETLFLLAEEYYLKGDILKSKRLFKDLKTKDEFYPNLNYYLALIALQSKKISRAQTYLKKEVKKHGNPNAKRLLLKLEIYSTFPFITLTLFILNLVAFFFTQNLDILELTTFGVSIYNVDFYQLITSLFFHVNIVHFLLNMIVLLSFGLYLEKFIGSLKFLSIYLFAGVLGNLFEILFLEELGFIVGASAAIFGVIGATFMREPLLSMRLFGFVRMPLILLLGFFILLSFIISSIPFSLPVLFGEIAHLTGLYIGILFSAFYYQETISTFYHWVFISFGFILIGLAIKQFSITKLDFVLENIFFIVVGIFLVVYSYAVLKTSRGTLKDE